MKVSIVMATYNGGAFLRNQLQSLLEQTRTPDELVITDDGSSDDTAQIVDAFRESSPFPIFFSLNPVRLGYVGNFNRALSKATGDLVFLCDQDDVWFPDKIASIEALALEYPDRWLFMNDALLTDGNLNEVGLTKLGQIRAAGLTDEAFVMGCCCAVRSRLLDICLPIPQDCRSHDNWIVRFADALGLRYIYPCSLQYYRRHGANTSEFIANRTSHISLRDRLRYKFQRLRQGQSDDAWASSVAQEELLIKGILRSIDKMEPEQARLARRFAEQKHSELRYQADRRGLRKAFLIKRLFLVLRFVLENRYPRNGRLRAVLRDVAGWPS